MELLLNIDKCPKPSTCIALELVRVGKSQKTAWLETTQNPSKKQDSIWITWIHSFFFVKLLLKGYNVSIFNSPFVTPGVAVTKDMFCCLLVYSMASPLVQGVTTGS